MQNQQLKHYTKHYTHPKYPNILIIRTVRQAICISIEYAESLLLLQCQTTLGCN